MILDARGNPIKQAQLKESQTATVGHLRTEFANHPSRGLTPSKLASILERAERGDLLAQCDLFDDMEEKDGHILSEMAKRKAALQNLKWDILPPHNATDAERTQAEQVKEILFDLPDFEDLVFDAADAIGKGFACLEYDGWHRPNGAWLPREIIHRPQRWFMTPQHARNQLRLRDGSSDGAMLQPFGWLVHVHRARSGYVGRAGLLRTLSWPYLFKNYSIRDLAEFLEIYGLPLRLGTYAPGASDKEKATLLRAVIGIGHDAAGIIPEGMAVDFKEAAKGTKDPFEAMIQWCERTQSKVIVGTVAPTDGASSGGNRALGDYSLDVMENIVASDARQLASTMTRDLIYPVAALNINGITHPSRAPRFVYETEKPEDLKLYSEALPKLVENGMRIPLSWAHEKLKIPEAEGDQAILQRSSAVTVPTTAARAVAAAALKGAAQERDLADDMADQLEALAADETTKMINVVRRMLNEAESLEAFKNNLLDAYGHLETDDLARVFRLGFAAAELGGRFEGQEGV